MIVKLICAGCDDFSKLYKYDNDEFLIAVDGGLKVLKKMNLCAHLAIGDFDSASINNYSNTYQDKLIYPKKKDKSDLELAIEYICDNYDTLFSCLDKIEIYNATGKRLDHFLSSINVLIKYNKLPLAIIDKDNFIKIIKKEEVFEKNEYKYISFFAIFNNTIISLTGFKYNLDSYSLNISDSLCLSNEILSIGVVKTNKEIIAIFSHKKKC